MYLRFLVDNNPGEGLECEWGLAAWIEYYDHVILLDSGASGLFAQNAEKLGLDLNKVEFGVLSHAHYDHSDGMEEFFQRNGTAPFYIREGSGENCYSISAEEDRYIGIRKGILGGYADRICYASGVCSPIEGVYILPHTTPNLGEVGKKANMYIRNEDSVRADDFSHEQSLIFKTEKGLVIFNSCSHAGADVVIREAAQAFPGEKLYALIGGFHLFESSREDVIAMAQRIRETGIEQVYTGHCTGDTALKLLQEELGEMVHAIYTGLEVTL